MSKRECVSMENNNFVQMCKEVISRYHNKQHAQDGETVSCEDVYVVWCCKTLQNHKALLSTPVPDGMYYEATYNGDKRELYLDAYRKVENICIPMEPEGVSV